MNKRAVALKYDERFTAPFIIAKGKDHLAEKILELARKNDIHIRENEELAENLMLFEIDSFIPEELYGMVAEILAFVYAVEKRAI